MRSWVEKHNEKIVYLIVFFVVFLLGVKKCESQTVREVDSVLKCYGIKHKDIVLKQSILETGWYTSYSCRERKNLFGFRYKGKYLEFKTWEESVAYYSRWQGRHFDNECCDDYYDFLVRRGYAEDPEYVNKLKAIRV